VATKLGQLARPSLNTNRILILRNLAARYEKFLHTPYPGKPIIIRGRTVSNNTMRRAVIEFEKLSLAKRVGKAERYRRPGTWLKTYRVSVMGLMCGFLPIGRALEDGELSEKEFVKGVASRFSAKLPLVFGKWGIFEAKGLGEAARSVLFHVMSQGGSKYLSRPEALGASIGQDSAYHESIKLERVYKKALYDEQPWAQWITDEFLFLYPKHEADLSIDHQILSCAREVWSTLDKDNELRLYKASWLRNRIKGAAAFQISSPILIPETLLPAFQTRLLTPALEDTVRAFHKDDIFRVTLQIMDRLVGVPFEDTRDLMATAINPIRMMAIAKLGLQFKPPLRRAKYLVARKDRDRFRDMIAIPSLAGLYFYRFGQATVWNQDLFVLERQEGRSRRLKLDYNGAKREAFEMAEQLWRSWPQKSPSEEAIGLSGGRLKRHVDRG
jgi:hypothetical protein